jgi:hypothetical protein
LSENSPPESSPDDLENIAAAAGHAETRATKSSAATRLTALEERVASIEPLLEQMQANSQIGPKLTEYIADLRAEQVFFNIARYAVGGISLLSIAGIAILLGLAIFDARSPLLKAPPVAIAAFVIGMVSGVALLINSFVKGIFRSTTERHSDGFLPPALETAVEFFNRMSGKH